MRQSNKGASARAPDTKRAPDVLRKVLPALDVSGLRILVVDDNPFAFSMIKRLLNTMRLIEIFNWDRAEGAIAEIARTKADLVIVDLDMPGKGGLELIKEIRHADAGVSHELPILVASAHADREHVIQARNAGANWVVVKPLSFRNLYDGLVRVVLDDRPFIDSPGYVGPCRRVHPRAEGAPAGGRRKDDRTPTADD